MAELPRSQRLIRELAACGLTMDRLSSGRLSKAERDLKTMVELANILNEPELLRSVLGEDSEEWRAYSELQEEFKRDTH